MSYKEDFYYKLLVKVLKAYKWGGISLVIISFSVLSFNFAPNIVYSLDTGAVESNTEVLLDSTVNTSILREVEENSVTTAQNNSNSNLRTANKLPDKNPNLTKEPTLIIDSIGVNGKVHTGIDGEAEIEKGIWMPPDFGSPASGQPIMMMAHRFGYISWSNEFRRTNSFYNLPNVQPGDEISIIWDQREYKYKISEVKEVTGTVTTDSDLILYTCKFFRAKDRIVVLADRIN
jgi:sortase (surface protein transpeptidase)